MNHVLGFLSVPCNRHISFVTKCPYHPLKGAFTWMLKVFNVGNPGGGVEPSPAQTFDTRRTSDQTLQTESLHRVSALRQATLGIRCHLPVVSCGSCHLWPPQRKGFVNNINITETFIKVIYISSGNSFCNAEFWVYNNIFLTMELKCHMFYVMALLICQSNK